MYKYTLIMLGMLLSHAIYAQQSDSWAVYLENDQVKISTRVSDCHYPEKGVHNRYVLLKFENLTSNPMTVNYQLDKWYNGKKINPDVNTFEVALEANGSKEGSCEDLTKGLHVYAKILELEAKSVLSKFDIVELSINGKKVQ